MIPVNPGFQEDGMTDKYDNIIDLPHHVSKKHPQLGRDSYAAQFSPFAALTGYEDIVSETARATDEKTELDDDAKLRLSNKLKILLDHLDENPVISVTYFLPDKRKSGGRYVTADGIIKKYDDYEKIIYMTNGTVIRLDDLYEISAQIITEYLPEEF